MTDLTPVVPSPIEREAGIAVWRQLEIKLADQIQQGLFGENGRLPTESALAKCFGVNRHTIRRAISALTERGLVRVERGRGMFVEDVVIDYPLTRRTSFSTNLLAQGRAPTSSITAINIVGADHGVADALSLGADEPVICRQAIGFADDVPINIGLTYFPYARFPGLAEQLKSIESISKALGASGIRDYRRASTRILTRLPTPSEAASLRQPVAQPVLVTEAIDVDMKGRPISYGVACFAGARVQISVEPDQEGI
ncbi:MAG: phosphonate metabolism transcriptional regulator PhnF [Geminicoccaceae bacterium]